MQSVPLIRLLLAAGIAMAAPLSAHAAPPDDCAPMSAQPARGDRRPPPPPGGPLMPGMPAPNEHEPLPPLLHGLELTEEQRDKVFEIMHGQTPLLRAKMKEIRKSIEALDRLVTATEFDDTKARALAETNGRAMADLTLLRARTDQQLVRLLTAEQRHQLAQRPTPPTLPSGHGHRWARP